MKLLIGIPAYNEEKTIKNVILSIPKKFTGIGETDILVVDDGSSDMTSYIAGKLGVKVLRHIINRGLGGSLKTIINYAKIYRYDILATFDADGQHDGKKIQELINPILSGKIDAVIGSRWLGNCEAPVSRKLINKLANVFTFFLYGINTSDSQSGFRAFSKKAIQKIEIMTDGMEVSSEILGEVRRNNLTFKEIQIEPIYTEYSLSKGQRLENAANIFINLLLKLFR